MTTVTGESFIDVDCAQRCKHGQHVVGDVFVSRKLRDEGRLIAVLSDGLGSGVKASVLATMTATMALRYTSAFVDPRKSARIIMSTLPICEVRKISYSTFTIVDLDEDGPVRIIEHDNPPVILLRGDAEAQLDHKARFAPPEWAERIITYGEATLEIGDRLIVFSDGVTQSGMERGGMPMGWGRRAVLERAREIIRAEPEIASQRLAAQLVDAAHQNDAGRAKDDITCAVIYFRRPRRLLVATGPPFRRERDAELAALVRDYPGRRAICGGTTATLVSRILGRPVDMDLKHVDPEVPPTARMDGIDLVTEGTLTLAKVAETLELGVRSPAECAPHGAGQLLRLMLESDIVDFVVGTRINEAHQDPNVPVELELRRTIVRRIAALLESRHLKRTTLGFL